MKTLTALVVAMFMILPAAGADEVVQEADRELMERKLTEHPFCGADCRQWIADGHQRRSCARVQGADVRSELALVTPEIRCDDKAPGLCDLGAFMQHLYPHA